MTCSPLCSALAALSVAAGCGDNSKVCGPGTDDLDDDGACEPGGAGELCGDGTRFDAQLNACVIDPGACRGGTVLIDHRCVDPTEGLVVDLSEGPEPNNAGLGGVEPSGAFAGVVALEGPGEAFVVKGNLAPFRDADGDGELDPDMDAYVVTVGAPALLELSVDGVGGLMGAFLVVPVEGSPATGWRRFGLNVTGDTSQRQIYLPAAGTYGISVADTRSLLVEPGAPPAAGGGAAAGGPGASYFLSVATRPAPAPVPLTAAGALGPGELAFFTAPMSLIPGEVELDIPATPRAAVVVLRNGAYHADAAEQRDPAGGDLPATVTTGGFQAGDRATIVVDTVYHYGPGAAPYTLTVR